MELPASAGARIKRLKLRRDTTQLLNFSKQHPATSMAHGRALKQTGEQLGHNYNLSIVWSMKSKKLRIENVDEQRPQNNSSDQNRIVHAAGLS